MKEESATIPVGPRASTSRTTSSALATSPISPRRTTARTFGKGLQHQDRGRIVFQVARRTAGPL